VFRHNPARRASVKGIAADAQSGTGAGGEVAGTLGTRGVKSHTELDGHGAYIAVPYDLYQITAPINRQNRQPGDPCHTLARDNAAHAAIAIQGNLVGRDTGGPHGVGASDEGAMYTLTKADTHAVAHAMPFSVCPDHCGGDKSGQDVAFVKVVDISGTLDCTGANVDRKQGGIGIASPMTVRRLTPRECERLQGFPDDYTAIPWRGKTETPDGPRYKALGNSMAVNCMEWIGERIAAQEVAQ
jgi:DNA (cytosine-5)-methyltransferase 1